MRWSTVGNVTQAGAGRPGTAGRSGESGFRQRPRVGGRSTGLIAHVMLTRVLPLVKFVWESARLRAPEPVRDKSPGHNGRGSIYSVLVEAAGIEPASESGSARTSTCIARCLCLASRVSDGRDTQDANRRVCFASSPSGQTRKLARVSDAPSRHHEPNRVERVSSN